MRDLRRVEIEPTGIIVTDTAYTAVLKWTFQPVLPCSLLARMTGRSEAHSPRLKSAGPRSWSPARFRPALPEPLRHTSATPPLASMRSSMCPRARFFVLLHLALVGLQLGLVLNRQWSPQRMDEKNVDEPNVGLRPELKSIRSHTASALSPSKRLCCSRRTEVDRTVSCAAANAITRPKLKKIQLAAEQAAAPLCHDRIVDGELHRHI